MLPAHRSNPRRSINLSSTTTVITRLLLVFTLAALAFCLLSVPVTHVHATGGSLSLGTISPSGPVYPCQGTTWFVYNGTTMNCQNASVQGCANVQEMQFTYGQLSPLGIAPGINTPANVNGVIVYFNGMGGTLPLGSLDESDEMDMLTYYFNQGYVIVQLSWSSDWEASYNPFPPNTPGNIQNAACRPATFLSYVNANIYNNGVFQGNPRAGMCAHGGSAGSAQVAYSLAYYGAGSFLDNVELISGPVFSDVKQGCQEGPQASPVQVCPSGQYGCQLGTDTPWTLSPTFIYPTYNDVGSWTNDHHCANTTQTNAAENAQWLLQSIVDQSTGAVPTFSYPSTGMTAFLCRTVLNGPPNNSSPQGQIFYSQITPSNPPEHYNVYSVDSCPKAEIVFEGTVTALTTQNGTVSGKTAIEQDMAGGALLSAQCFHRTHQ